jgi:hypothetical protein
MMRTRAATAAVLVLTGAITGVAPATAGVAKTSQHSGKPQPKRKPSPKITGWTVKYSGSGSERYRFDQPAAGTFTCTRADQQEEGNTSASWSVTWEHVQLRGDGGEVGRPSAWSGSASMNGFLHIGACDSSPAVQSTCRWNLQPMPPSDHSIDSTIIVRRVGGELTVKADIAPLVSDRGEECQSDPGAPVDPNETPTKLLLIASGRAKIDGADLVRRSAFSVGTSDADAEQNVGELSPQYDCSDPSQEITCHDNATWSGTLSFTPEFAKTKKKKR